MTAAEIVEELKSQGQEGYRKILRNHGVTEPLFGVKIGYLKNIRKRIKQDYQLALDLYDTGIYDAMYLAGLIADDRQMTKKDLQHWLKRANCDALRQYTIPWVASGSKHGHELALEWIASEKESVALAGWSTLACLISVQDDAELDLAGLKRLLRNVQKRIHEQPNLVRYVMNGFVIAVGCYVAPLTDKALEVAAKIGVVVVDMGPTACKVPDAAESIRKVQQRGMIGKKRKTAKC